MSELSFVDVRSVLAKIVDLERDLVLVGGQAVNFWASRYQPRVPELGREAPFTSKDIDFCGDQKAVRICADRLGGTPRLATPDDATPNSGTVVFVDIEHAPSARIGAARPEAVCARVALRGERESSRGVRSWDTKRVPLARRWWRRGAFGILVQAVLRKDKGTPMLGLSRL